MKRSISKYLSLVILFILALGVGVITKYYIDIKLNFDSVYKNTDLGITFNYPTNWSLGPPGESLYPPGMEWGYSYSGDIKISTIEKTDQNIVHYGNGEIMNNYSIVTYESGNNALGQSVIRLYIDCIDKNNRYFIKIESLKRSKSVMKDIIESFQCL